MNLNMLNIKREDFLHDGVDGSVMCVEWINKKISRNITQSFVVKLLN